MKVIFKKKILIPAIVLGCVCSMIAMIPTNRNVDAAVMVYDEQNVAEAIKTAINTANILTETQKELALQIIDMTSMSQNKLEDFLKRQVIKQDGILDESENKVGVLNGKTSVESYWENNFRNIESVLNGDITVVDAYNANQKAMKALEKTNYDALHNAKTTQIATQEMSENLSEVITNSANAEGNKEAIQANTQAVAATAMGVYYGNNLLSDLVAQQSLKHQKENLDEANALAFAKSVAKQAEKDVADMKAAAR